MKWEFGGEGLAAECIPEAINLVAAIEDDTAVPDEVKRYPLMRRHHRRADGQLRTTRALSLIHISEPTRPY